jgi:hypothetical protein
VTKATALNIDVGWSYRLTPGPTRLVLASNAGPDHWPPDDLLVIEGEKGVFGKIKIEHPKYSEYEHDVVELVARFIEDRTLIVIPELSGSKSIEEKIRKLLDESGKHCIVVGGSYYRDLDRGRVEHVCPILIPQRETFYQRKFTRAAIENPGFDTVDRRVVLIFRHTGFGDFAVLVCSDALDHDPRKQYIDKLRNEIDFLVVPARNADPQLIAGLRPVANNERWCVVYCNGYGTHGSEVISPYKSESPKAPHITDHCASFDLGQFQLDMQNDEGVLHHRTELERYFEPRPRHWPFRGLRASGFSDHLRVVAIGSHFDDVWLGCSGTLMRLRECYNAQIRIITLCNFYPTEYYDRFKLDGTILEELYRDLDSLCGKLGFQHEQYQGPALQDQSFNEAQVHSYMKTLDEKSCHTDMLFVPRQDDVHHDHAATAKAAMLEFRGANVFEYEIKDFRRSQFKPNLLVDMGIRSNQSLELGGKVCSGVTFANKKAFILENAFRIMDGDLPLVVQKEHTLGRMAFRASQSGTELTHAEAFVAEMII